LIEIFSLVQELPHSQDSLADLWTSGLLHVIMSSVLASN